MLVVDKIMDVKQISINKRATGVDDVYVWDGTNNINIRVNPSEHLGRDFIQSMAGKRVRLILEVIEDENIKG